jgi:Fe-S-cluster containining protein
MSPTRQQRRLRRRELARAGEAVLKRGVPGAPRFIDLLGLTFVLLQALKGKSGRSPATACAELAHRAFEASLRADPPARALACQKGCAYCCYATVTLTAPEAFLVARAVRGMRSDHAGPNEPDFLARAASTANLGAAQRLGRKLPCAVLAGKQCSAYVVRPLACRRVTSFAVEPCIEEYEGQEGEILLPQKHVTHATSVQAALLAALQAFGRPARLYELSAAVRAVFETADAEAKWLAGGDVFDGVLTEHETVPEIAASIARLSAEARSIDAGDALGS